MIVVLDVSAAIEILLNREKRSIYQKVYDSSEWIIAPDLYVSELSNAFWKLHKAGILDDENCLALISSGIDLIYDFIEAADIWKEGFREGVNNRHPVYDMLYAVLARRHDATLLTNDRLLAGICHKLQIKCVF